MDKVLRNVVNKVIELKKLNVNEVFGLDLDKSPEFKGLDKRVNNTLESLKAKVSSDVYKSVLDIIEFKDLQAILYMNFYFKKRCYRGSY